MFDLGWDEMAVIAVLALIVLGPKELPNALRTVSALMKNARKLANEFQSGVNEIIREADLEDARKKLAEVNKNSISKAIENTVDPTGEMKAALNTDPTGSTPKVDAPKVEAAKVEAAPAAAAAIESGEDHAVEVAASAPTLPPSPPVHIEPAPASTTSTTEAAVAEKS
jgi:sec-independent protein translocase protein TatB